MLHLPTNLLNKFQELIYGRSALQFSPSRLVNLEVKLRNRAQARRVADYAEYYQLLEQDDRELQVLIDLVTTKETYFFRLPGQFQVFQKHILPQLEERLADEISQTQAEPSKSKIHFRIWSAGCATGAEPYSIAMAMMEGLHYPRAWKTEILASDISHEAVNKASQGFFEMETLKNIPVPFQGKYLTLIKDGFMISNELRQRIQFRVFNLKELDLIEQEPSRVRDAKGGSEVVDLKGRFEVIFCRNVLIYFDFLAQQNLVNGLYACLKPGGYLFTGDAEPLHLYRHQFKICQSDGTFYYRKSESCFKEQGGE